MDTLFATSNRSSHGPLIERLEYTAEFHRQIEHPDAKKISMDGIAFIAVWVLAMSFSVPVLALPRVSF